MSDNRSEFDADYVKKLREEAAGWRTKYRELEGQVAYTQVDAEFARRGIKADPSWVTVKEGQKISEAVDDLVKKHPYLAGTEPQKDAPVTTETPPQAGPIRPTPPRPMTFQQTDTNAPGADASGLIRDRSFGEIKKDPVARAKLRDLYRGLIQQSSNQGSVPE